MAEAKERSGIFKFFYVVLSIITFPIFMVLFILRHPMWILFILLLLAGIAFYYPINQEGVKPDDVLSWYQKKYTEIKINVVNKAVDSGTTNYLPKAVLNDVKKIEEEAKEAQMPKSENYNQKVIRDTKGEETKVMLKKRGGFKKKEEAKGEEPKADDGVKEESSEVDILTEGVSGMGGLSALLKNNEEKASETVEEESDESVKEIIKEIEETTITIPDAKPILPEPVAEPVKPVIPEPVAEKTQPNKNEDDLELDLF